MPNAEQHDDERERHLDSLIAEYYRLREAGGVVDQSEFIQRNPGFTSELKEFFSDVRLVSIQDHSDSKGNFLGADIVGTSRRAKRIAESVMWYFGEYEILEELGAGGMGVVYKARQAKLKRIVALKMIRSGELANSTDVQRFEAEARAAAKLSHPGIVPVYEVGIHNGRHFYTMDYVEGGSLSKMHRDKPVPARHAAKLVRHLAESMHYAHLKGIVHRDLKPENILLTAQGEPKITDFGLAKRVRDEDDTQSLPMTQSGQILGTAGYMSPEQAAGKTHLVGPSSDVYALGAVLYALLTSRAPFVGETPSHTIAQVLQNEPVSPRKLNPSVPRDLETICLTCLEKETHKRYGTAQLLADDLGLFLEGKPVKARPVNKVTKASRWAYRNPWIAATLLLIIFSGLGSAYSALEQSRLRTLADRSLEQAKTALKDSQWNVYKARLFPMLAAYREKDFGQLEELLEASVPLDDGPDFRGWEWYFFDDQVQRRTRNVLRGRGPWRYVQYSDDGKLVAVRHADGNVHILDGVSLRVILRIPGDTQRQLAWQPKGSLLAIPRDLNELQIWDVKQHKRVVTVQTAIESIKLNDRGVAWKPDGTQVALGGLGRIDLFSVSGQHLKTLNSIPAEAKQLDWHPNGKLLAVGGSSSLAVIDIQSNTEVWKKFQSHVEVFDIEWNPQGTRLGSAWDWPTNQIIVYEMDGEQQAFPRLTSPPKALAWSSDGNTILSVGHDQQTYLWSVESGGAIRSLKVHGSPVEVMDWNTATNTAVSIDLNGDMRVFRSIPLSDTNAQFKVPVGVSSIWWAEWCPTDLDIFACGAEHHISICRASTSEIIQELNSSTPITWLSWHPSEKRLVTLDQAGLLVEWDPLTAKKIREIQSNTFEYTVTAGWSPDGKYLAATAGQRRRQNSEGSVDVFSAASGELLFQLDIYRGRVRGGWSPDSRRYATHSQSHGSTVRILDVQQRKLVGESVPFLGVMERLAYSPDGTKIVMGGETGAITLLDARTLKVLQTTQVHSSRILGLQWSPAGRRLLCTTADDALTIFDGPSGERLVTFNQQDGVGCCGMWSPDGGRIVTVSAAGDVKIWGSLSAERNESNWIAGLDAINSNKTRDLRQDISKPESPLIAFDGRIEGEALYVRNIDSGRAFVQDMAPHGSDRWSRGQQLLWLDAQPGDKLELEFDLNSSGNFRFATVLTTAPDFAIVDLKLNGVVIANGIDLYRPNIVDTTGQLELGTHALKAGWQQLVIEIKGSNEASIKKHGIGIDYLELNPEEVDQEVVEKDAINANAIDASASDLIPHKP